MEFHRFKILGNLPSDPDFDFYEYLFIDFKNLHPKNYFVFFVDLEKAFDKFKYIFDIEWALSERQIDIDPGF